MAQVSLPYGNLDPSYDQWTALSIHRREGGKQIASLTSEFGRDRTTQASSPRRKAKLTPTILICKMIAKVIGLASGPATFGSLSDTIDLIRR